MLQIGSLFTGTEETLDTAIIQADRPHPRIIRPFGGIDESIVPNDPEREGFDGTHFYTIVVSPNTQDNERGQYGTQHKKRRVSVPEILELTAEEKEAGMLPRDFAFVDVPREVFDRYGYELTRIFISAALCNTFPDLQYLHIDRKTDRAYKPLMRKLAEGDVKVTFKDKADKKRKTVNLAHKVAHTLFVDYAHGEDNYADKRVYLNIDPLVALCARTAPLYLESIGVPRIPTSFCPLYRIQEQFFSFSGAVGGQPFRRTA